MMTIRKHGRLPHWDIKDTIQFVTFNLHDAFPAEYRAKLEREKQIRIAELERIIGEATPAERHEIDQLLRERAEEMLDTSAGEGTWAIRGSRKSSQTG